MPLVWGVGVCVYSLLGVRRWYGACVAHTLWCTHVLLREGVALRYLFGQSWFVLIGLFILRFLDDFVW